MTTHASALHGGKAIAVADLGSAGAGVSIIYVRKGDPAKVLLAERTYLPPSESNQTVDALITQLGTFAEKVASKYLARNPHGPRIKSAYVIMRPPWMLSKSAYHSSTLPPESIIDYKVISGIARDILTQEKEYESAQIVDSHVVRVEINGYPTRHPEGKRGSEVAVSALLSACDPGVRTRVEEAIMRSFGVRPELRSGVRVLDALMYEGVCPSSCLVVDMTGETTNAAVFRHGVVAEQSLVPEGMYSIIRRVAGNGMPEEALSLIRMVGEDHCDTAACEAIRAQIAQAEPELVRIFASAFEGLASKRRISEKLILIAHPSLLPWLRQFFSRPDFAPYTLTRKPFSVETITQDSLSRLVVSEADVEIDLDFLIGAALVNSEENDE